MADKPDKPHLDVLGGLFRRLDPEDQAPSLDRAREVLGGPWQGGPDIGRVVSVPHGLTRRVGVVIHSSPTERDVWIGGGRIQRVAAAKARLMTDEEIAAEEGASFTSVAADAHVHASLSEGQRVLFQRRDGSVEEGVLVERLRYGSLVGHPDGRVLAVSFGRIGPADEGVAS